LLAPILLGSVFNDTAFALIGASDAATQSMCNWLVIFGAFAGVLFFGWGFDGCRAAALKTWVVCVLVCTILAIWGTVSSNFFLVPVLVGLL